MSQIEITTTHVFQHIVGTEDENVYSEYFQYVMSELSVTYPNTLTL